LTDPVGARRNFTRPSLLEQIADLVEAVLDTGLGLLTTQHVAHVLVDLG
jgi:hypothetical protein